MRDVVLRFGPFELDPSSRQLFRDEKRVHISHQQAAILTCLASHVGVIVSKQRLMDAAWGGMAISENTLEKAISKLRQVLGKDSRGATYIETTPQEGYRFIAPVQQQGRSGTHASLDTQLAPFRSFVQGQTALDTLDRAAIGASRSAFDEAL